jgi:hypothetical protein
MPFKVSYFVGYSVSNKPLFIQIVEISLITPIISPRQYHLTSIHFNAEAYKASDVYKLKDQAEQQTKEYLSFKDEQGKFREQLKNKKSSKTAHGTKKHVKDISFHM